MTMNKQLRYKCKLRTQYIMKLSSYHHLCRTMDTTPRSFPDQPGDISDLETSTQKLVREIQLLKQTAGQGPKVPTEQWRYS